MFSNPAYANRSKSATSPTPFMPGPGTGKTRSQWIAKRPTAMSRRSGSSLQTIRITAVRAPCLTPATLMAVSPPSTAVTTSARPAPPAAPDQTPVTACAAPFESDAAAATRAIHVIQPTSKPTNSPNASRV